MDCGIGTFLVFMVLLAGMLINEWRQGNIVWDSSRREIRQKNPAEKAAGKLKHYSIDNYNISWRDRQ